MSRRRAVLWTGFGALAVVSVLDHAGAFGHRRNERSRYEGALAVVSTILSASTIELDLPDAGRPTTRTRLRGVAGSGSGEAAATPARSEGDSLGDCPAVEYLREQVLGRRVRLHFDPNRKVRDADGLLSAYVYLLEGVEDELNPTMLNEWLISEGLARADQSNTHVFSHTFQQREKLAQKSKRGIWGAGVSK